MKLRMWCSQYPAMPVRDGLHYKIITLSSLYVPRETQISLRAVISLCRRLIWGSLCQEALSLLAENAELNEEDGRGVAFRRSEAVLKALPKAVTSLTELRGLPCLGEHSLRVIKASSFSSRSFFLLFNLFHLNSLLKLLSFFYSVI